MKKIQRVLNDHRIIVLTLRNECQLASLGFGLSLVGHNIFFIYIKLYVKADSFKIFKL